jgi:hypothetical protein
MAFIELTRLLPESKKAKWTVNTSNIVYFQEPTDLDSKVGCTLVDTTGADFDVVEPYREVSVKFKDL